MKRRQLLLAAISLILTICMCFSLIGCGKKKTDPETLATPVVSIATDGKASWTAVENASGYAYKINNGEEKDTTETSVTLTNGQSIVVKAVGDGENYLDSAWSTSKTYTAPSSGNTENPPSGGTENPPSGGTENPPSGGTENPPSGGTENPPSGGNTHTCGHVCQVTGCGKCTDNTCDKPECASKCPGHGSGTTHTCEHVCQVTGCGKCTDNTCDKPECASKCPGHGSGDDAPADLVENFVFKDIEPYKSMSSNTTLTDETKTVSNDDVSITFAVGTNSYGTGPLYNVSETAIRNYYGNTITVESEDSSIVKIELTYVKGNASNTLTANVGKYTQTSDETGSTNEPLVGTWTGSAKTVVFSVGATSGQSGHYRFKSIKVTYNDPNYTDAQKTEKAKAALTLPTPVITKTTYTYELPLAGRHGTTIAWNVTGLESGDSYTAATGVLVVNRKLNAQKSLTATATISSGSSVNDQTKDFPITVAEKELTKLNTPVVEISADGLATWTLDSRASSAKYKISGGSETDTTANGSVQLTNGQSIEVQAIGDNVDYTNSDWSAAKPYTAGTLPAQPFDEDLDFTTNFAPTTGTGYSDGWKYNGNYGAYDSRTVTLGNSGADIATDTITGTVVLSNASRQTGTITNQPTIAAKSNLVAYVTVDVTDGGTITAAEFSLTCWSSSKYFTDIHMEYYLNDTWTTCSDVFGSTTNTPIPDAGKVITSTSIPAGVTKIRLSITGKTTSNSQVGLSSIKLTIKP